MALYEGDHSPELRDPPFVAPVAGAVAESAGHLCRRFASGTFCCITRTRDFSSVVNFLEQAAADPDVLAIKQTLYRTGGDPRIIGALESAVKQRQAGDRGGGIARALSTRPTTSNGRGTSKNPACTWFTAWWATRSMPRPAWSCGAKDTHPALRSPRDRQLQSNHRKLYTDIGLLTCRPEFGEDVTNLFNLLTGICQFQRMRKLLVAPFDLHERMVGLIERKRRMPPGAAGAHRREAEFAGGSRDDRGAVPRVAGGGGDRFDRARHLLPAAGTDGISETSRCAASSIGSSSTAGFFTSRMPASQKCSWPAPIGCHGISFGGSRWLSLSKTGFCGSA